MAESLGEGLYINSYTENYLRLHLLEVTGGTTVLQNLFLKIVRNSSAKGDVDKYLCYFKCDIKRHKQGSEELKILFPDSGPTDIGKWDVSLLAYVLVHCCTLEGQLNLKRQQNPRQILKREIKKHGDLPQFLSNNKKILDNLIITGRITEQQYETLYSQTHETVKIEAWDVELVLQVLLKVCNDAGLLQMVRSACTDVLNRQVEMCSTNAIVLDELLKHHQNKFYQFKEEGKLTDNEYKQIFPDKSPPDSTNWDNEVLICVVVNTSQSLSQVTCKDVKTIRQMRKDLGAHTADTKINNDDFFDKWTDLHGVIIGITVAEIPETLNDVKEMVDSIKRGPLDIQNSVANLSQWYSNQDRNNVTILNRLSDIEQNAESTKTDFVQKMNELTKKVDQLLQKFPEPEYSQIRNTEELKVVIDVNGEKKDAVSNSETSIYKVMNGTEDDNTNPLLHPMERIKQTFMQSNDGNEIERIEKGSIILVVKCSSLRGVHNLLKTLKSNELKECLGQLQDVLTKINKCPIRLSIHLANSSLLKIMEMVVKFAPQSEETSSPDEQNTLQTVLEVSSDLKKHQEDTNEAASAPGVPQSSETKPWSGDNETREAASVPGVPQASEAKPWPGDAIFMEAASAPGVPQASETKPWSGDDETRDMKKKFEKRQWLKTETTSDPWVPQTLSLKQWSGDYELIATISDSLVSQTLSTKPWPGDHESKGNTTNLMSHLKLDHKHLLSEQKEQAQPKIDSTIKRAFGSGGTGKLSTEKKAKLDDLLMQVMVDKALPLSLLDHPIFRTFIVELEPRYALPSKKSVVKCMEGKASEMKDKIAKDVAGQQVSLTHDGWTSISTQSFDTVTCHMINDNWELKSAVLQTKKIEGQHTGEHIAENLQQTIDGWGLTPAVITTDNAANEVKAVKLLGLTRFGCFGHRINLIVKKSLQVPYLSNLLKKGRSMVTFFHKSSSASDLLIQNQRIVYFSSPELIGHRLIMDCPTRWNSTLDMLIRLLEQTPAVTNVASVNENLSKTATNTIKANVYTFEEQTVLQDVVKVLKSFKKATTILCCENTPSIQYVCAITEKLQRCILATEEDNETVQTMKEIMRTEMIKRTETEDISLLAAILNPDTKNLGFLEENEKEKAIELLKQRVYEQTVLVKKEQADSTATPVSVPELPNLPSLPEEDTDSSSQPNEDEPVSKKSRIVCSDSVDWLSDVCIVGESSVPMADLIREELDRYLRSERKETDSNLTLLQWWKENEYQYPRISRIAKSVLAVPASSVPSERVFSLAGNIVSKKRARMKPELVDMLIFLKMNRKTYW